MLFLIFSLCIFGENLVEYNLVIYFKLALSIGQCGCTNLFEGDVFELYVMTWFELEVFKVDFEHSREAGEFLLPQFAPYLIFERSVISRRAEL